MIDYTATFGCASQGIEMAKISGDELDRKIFEVVTTACRSNETLNLFTAFEQNSNKVRSDESGSSCDEYGHCGVDVRLRQRFLASTVPDVNNLDAFAPFVHFIEYVVRTKGY